MTTILIIESNTPDLLARGWSGAQPFVETLQALNPALDLQVVQPYAGAPDPGALDRADGVIFTGSGVDWDTSDARARPLARMMEDAFARSLPVWGSCNGMQLCASVLGGAVAASPKGREDGFARDLTLGADGQAHPMMVGRADGFAAPCVHRDEVQRLPTDAVRLAGNAHSPVQAFVVQTGGVDFWGTQYHPEYSASDLVDCLQDKPGGPQMIADLAHADTDATAAARLGVAGDTMQPAVRATELRNWLTHLRGTAGG
ncbi:MAG: type 1 glutamine amidotransferase [Marinibacterium sp.]|nr:type 1 glutamine amidotransferase [Marinibacterium sp.]